MKKIICVIVLAAICLGSFAQEEEKVSTFDRRDASIEVGLRDNQFAHLNFIGESGWIVGLEQSLLNVKLNEQVARLFVGQNRDYKYFGFTWMAYAGMDYHRNYGIYGARASMRAYYKRLMLGATFNPNYDSGYKFQGNYQVEGSVRIFEQSGLDVTASYGNIPEFRNNIENFRLGLKFTSESRNLWVKPEICMPGIGDGSEYLRVLVSMGWRVAL